MKRSLKMKKLTFSLALTLCFLILLQTGCSLFSGSSGDSSVYIESEKSLLLKTRTDKEIDFTTDGFSFYLPADSLSGNKEISIESMLHFTNSDQKSFFTPVSKLYDINIFGNAIIMTKSAKLGFLVPAGLERNHLFAFRKTAAGKWHIFSELPQNQSGQAYFSSAYPSKWFLARRIRTNQTSLLSAPQISLSSEKLYYNSKKLFTEDILINCYFETVSSNLLQEHLFVHEITAQAETPFKLAFKTDAENLQNFDSAQSDNGLHLIKINSDVAEFKEIAANTASYTFCLKLNKEDARNYPENILIQALVTDSDNFTYENNIVLTAIEEPEPQPATSPIALEFSVPRNNESDVDPGNSITLAFNHPIDPESFLQSFSIAPQTASPTFNWNQTHKEVQISFKQGLTEETDYLISIHNNLQGQNKEILVQSLEIKFSTGETTPPEIKGFYPDESRLLPLNGNLQIIFSEPVKPDSLRLEIIPETSLVTELTNEILYIGPKNNWQPSTQYQITIMDGLSDLKNNQTQQTQTFIFYTSDQSAAKILSFTPESGFETASVSTSISILFDRGMKTDASEKAFIFPDNFPTTQFAWSDDFTQLLISFPLPLEFNSIYKFIISDSAEALDGTKLANQYSYQFKTISRPEVIAAELIPDQGATNIATNSTIMIPFNREMNQSSVEKAFILINENSEPIEGIFFWNLNRLEFKPHKPLSPGKTYKIFIGKSATDVFNNNIAEAFSSSFTTQPHARVFLKSHFPENQASNISFDSSIILEFSDAIAKETLSFSVEPPVKGGYSTKWENNDKKVSITFYAGFNSGATYQFLVSDSIRDKYEQNIIKPEPFNFTIEEYNYPRLIEILPANQSEKISPLTTITLLFDQPMNEESVISALEFEPEPDALIDYSWNSDSTKLIIEFSSFLEFAQTYVINLNRQAKNKNGLNLDRKSVV